MAAPASTAAVLPTTSAASSPSPSATAASATSNAAAPTTTTLNAASSTPSTSSSTSQTTSGTGSAQSSSTGSTLSSTPTTAQVVTSGGSIEAITSTSFVTSTVTPSSKGTSTSNSFFSNTAAVAGVFTVVGLIVVALVVALVVNAIRRRRAEKFDRDVAEAAAEAAASSRSPFDDYSYTNTGGNGGGGGGGGYGYSDNSHGTYQLPPVSPRSDAYGMTEMSQYDPYAAGAASLAASAVGRSRSRKESEPGTPGIAGVGAGSLAREPSKRAPYHAFAGPGPQPHELQGSNGTFRSRRGNQDVLEAAGLAGTGATHNLNNGATYVTRKPSDTAQNTQFSGRPQLGSMSSGGHLPPTLQPGYPVESYYPQRNDSLSPDPFAGYPPAISVSKPLPNPHEATVPSPSPPGRQSDHTEDIPDSGSPTALRSDEQRMSYQDDADYSQGHRVLRVANE